MNISELFIRRPVMTTLVMAGIFLFGVVGLPPAAGQRSAERGLSRRSPCRRESARREPGDDGFLGRHAARETVLHHRRHRSMSSQSARAHVDHDAIHARPQHRRGGAGRAVGHREDAQPVAAEHAPAVVSESQSGDSAHSLPGAALRRRCRCRRSTNTARHMLAQRISTVNGVAQVQVYGSQKYAVRIQVDPAGSSPAHGSASTKWSDAVAAGNVNQPTGMLYGQRPGVHRAGERPAPDARRLSVRSSSRIATALRCGSQRCRAACSTACRTTRSRPGSTTTRAIVLAIQRQPGTNTVEVVEAVQESAAATSRRRFPASVNVDMLYRPFGRRSANRCHDVKFTLSLTLVLVVLVIFLFLRNLSATIIPSLALPMSLVGTFAVDVRCSATASTTFRSWRSRCRVGFVVDDAIVMLENIVRHMENGRAGDGGRAQRLARNRLHDHFHDAVARRGVHSGSVHGRTARAAVA